MFGQETCLKCDKISYKGIEHLSIDCFELTGRGVKTDKNIQPGEEIIKLPLELIMTGKMNKIFFR